MDEEYCLNIVQDFFSVTGAAPYDYRYVNQHYRWRLYREFFELRFGSKYGLAVFTKQRIVNGESAQKPDKFVEDVVTLLPVVDLASKGFKAVTSLDVLFKN